MEMPGNNRLSRFVGLGLVLGTAVAYGRVVGCDFINYDDPLYVIDNPGVRNGLTIRVVLWAFKDYHALNWHPLTWISHALDCQIYGLKPAGHHLTSLLLHIANTLLLFGVLRRMTGALWRSAIVAALFGWHPIHVESVAWIAERKDVLSALFLLLSLGAYVRYTEERRAPALLGGMSSLGVYVRYAEEAGEKHQSPSAKHQENSKLQAPTGARPSALVRGANPGVWYGLCLLFFALGLMSKPMVVTLPFLLLLLDYWPLNRISNLKSEISNPLTWGRLLLEKAPFFVLAAVASSLTFWLQKSGGAVVPLGALTSGQRVANALVSVVRYLGKMIWPLELGVVYPHPISWPARHVIGAAMLLLAITAGVVASRRRELLVAWLWFLGMLVPVIGLVQVGMQSMADRYTYLPSIGVFIMVVWGLSDLSEGWTPPARWALGAGTGLILAGCIGLAAAQVRTWQNSLTLFGHALALAPDNYMARYYLALRLQDLGKDDEAIADFEAVHQAEGAWAEPVFHLAESFERKGSLDRARECYESALRLKPAYILARCNLARLLARQGRSDEAASQFNECLYYDPKSADIHYNLANLLASEGNLKEAAGHYRESLRLDPDSADAHNNLGAVLLRLGAPGPAAEEFQAALKLKPSFPEAEDQLGGALQKLGQLDAARSHYAAAVRLKPDLAHAQLKLGLLLAGQRQFEEAKVHLDAATRLEPTNDAAWYNLAGVYAAQGQLDDAAAGFAKVVELSPNDAEAHARLGGVLDQAGRLDEAISQMEAATRLAPDSARAHCELGTVLAAKGRRDPAIDQFIRALQLQPGYVEAAQKLRALRDQKGD
jgi:protein O-mannosyl-transferase